jgi:cation diffusion facilitator CzcD-associated flavoprotein CzcO
MSNQNNVIFKDCVVVGAGISGIAIARWLKVSDASTLNSLNWFI